MRKQKQKPPYDCSSACLPVNRGMLDNRTNTNADGMIRQIELKSKRNNSAESEKIFSDTY
jgi:hypothetical protein